MMALLLVIALLANVDRFVLGTAGPLRAHDLSDNTVTGFAECGQFWTSALSSVWDATQLRGWPLAAGPLHPQLLMCVVGGVVPPPLVFPILHTVLLAVMIVGTFLFVLLFLQGSREVAVAGAVLNVALHYFFHEHPIITSATLLPALIGFLAVSGPSLGARVLLVSGAGLVMALSNPPLTLIVMPLGHLALISIVEAPSRRRHLIRWAAFWCLYGLYYSPTMVAQVLEFPNSNRSLFKGSAEVSSFLTILRERLFSALAISPAIVLLSLVGRRTWLRTLGVLAVVVGGLALLAANQAFVVSGPLGQWPFVLALAETYYRMTYLVPVGVLIWAVWLMRDADPGRGLLTYAVRAAVIATFCVAVAYPLSGTSRVFGPYWHYALVLGLAMGLDIRW